MSRGNRIAACAALAGAWLVAGGAQAAPIELLGTRLELPFGYQVQHVRESFSQGYGLRAERIYELLVTDGEAKGGTVQVDASYYSPDRIDAGVVQGWLRADAEKAAADKDNRAVQPLQIDGFGFTFVDGALKSGDYPQRMLVNGAVNGAVYRVGVYAKDTKPLSPALAASLKALRIDYPALLRVRSDFDTEATASVSPAGMVTPLGLLSLPHGVSARLSSSFVERDGNGKPGFRRRNFSLHKTGFWTIQNLVLSVSCGDEQPDAYANFIGMTSEQKDEDEKDRWTNVTPTQPARLAGLPAETATASGGQIGIRHTDVTRWAAHAGGRFYGVQIERLNGSPIETSLGKQLATAKPECLVGQPFGNPAQANASASPPPAPPAPPAPAAR